VKSTPSDRLRKKNEVIILGLKQKSLVNEEKKKVIGCVELRRKNKGKESAE